MTNIIYSLDRIKTDDEAMPRANSATSDRSDIRRAIEVAIWSWNGFQLLKI